MLGSSFTALRWFTDPYTYLDELSQTRGFSFDLDLPMMGTCFVTGEPQWIEAVHKNKNLVGGAGTQFLNAVVGNSVITRSGEAHSQKRKALNPFFYNGDMSIVDQLTAQRMNEAFKHIKKDSIFSVEEAIEDVTLKVILDFIFGDLDDITYNSILEAVHGWKTSFKNPLFLFLKPLQVNISKNWGWGRFLHFRDRLRALIKGELHTPHFKSRPGFLSDFQKKVGNSWSDDDLAWEVISVLVFGHDTGSVAAAWWSYHMLKNHCWGTLKNTAEIESSLKEAMRFSPPVVHLTRMAEQDTDLLEKKIKKGTRVLPCIYLAHHNPAIFENPGQFSPRRFLENKKDLKFSFIPFGFGDRLCLGKNFAERQMLFVAKGLLDTMDLELVKPVLRTKRKLVLMAPEGGTPVRVKKI